MNNIRNNINTFSNVDVTRFLSSATGEMLLQAGNQAYIQLQTEVLMLRYVRVLAHRIALPISIQRNQSLRAQLTQRISDNNTLIKCVVNICAPYMRS